MYSTLDNIASIPVFDDMSRLYAFLGLPVDGIHAGSQFAIHRVGDGQADTPYRSPVCRSGFYSFLFLKKSLDQHAALHFIPTGHCKSFVWENVMEAYLVSLSESFLKEHVHPSPFDSFPFLQAITHPLRIEKPEAVSTLEHLYKQIFGEYLSHSAYRNKIIGNLLMVLLLKIKEFLPVAPPDPVRDRKAQIVHVFKQTLESHYRDLLNGKGQKVFRVQDYATAQNLNPNYLNCVIKNKTGKPVTAWITDKTVAEAKSLLSNSSISIKEIAYLLGFAESNHFSNYFKKHCGLSPVSYRKQTGNC
jgi:AraC family transcriptional regulator, transcriptional activator of pobA